MAAVQGGVRFDKIAEKWHGLAQRRLAATRELDRSGRWTWYYTEEQFLVCLRDAERAVAIWAKLASWQLAVGRNDIRPAA